MIYAKKDDIIKQYYGFEELEILFGFKIGKKLIGAAAVAAVITAALTGCSGGSEQSASPTPSSAAGALSGISGIEEGYDNYINSFVTEMGEFVNGEMDEVLLSVGDINADNYPDWKAKYQDALERTERWYSEINTAQMLVSEDRSEAHTEMIQTVGVIYKIFEGFSDRVAAADGGDYSQLTDMASEYSEASEIAHTLWDHAVEITVG